MIGGARSGFRVRLVADRDDVLPLDVSCLARLDCLEAL